MKIAVVLLSLFTAALFFSCDKDPEIIVQTVTVTDTVTIIETIVDTFPESATTFILLRHAETEAGTNPNLSAVGQTRADQLSNILQNIELSAVFSTDYNRTQETAAPTGIAQSLTVESYDATDLNIIADLVLADHNKEAVLVVGHSNTTADLLNVLIGETTYADLPETEYDNLFIVTTYEKGLSEVLHLKY